MEELTEYFSTDNKVVLKYIVNDSRVLQIFVANSVQAIQEYSSVNQWSYILSEDNPVNGVSRGMEFNYFSNITRWFQGPAFFWETQSNQERSSAQEANQNSTPDLEWKKQLKVSSVITKEDFISSLENRWSCWLKLKRVIEFVLRCKVNYHRKQRMPNGVNKKVIINFASENLCILDTSPNQQTEKCIIKLVQSKYFSEEMKKLLIKKQGSEGAEIQTLIQMKMV